MPPKQNPPAPKQPLAPKTQPPPVENASASVSPDGKMAGQTATGQTAGFSKPNPNATGEVDQTGTQVTVPEIPNVDPFDRAPRTPTLPPIPPTTPPATGPQSPPSPASPPAPTPADLLRATEIERQLATVRARQAPVVSQPAPAAAAPDALDLSGINVEEIQRLLSFVDVPRLLRAVVSISSFMSTHGWNRSFLAQVEEITGDLVHDDLWVSLAITDALARMDRSWAPQRAARAVFWMAAFTALSHVSGLSDLASEIYPAPKPREES